MSIQIFKEFTLHLKSVSRTVWFGVSPPTPFFTSPVFQCCKNITGICLVVTYEIQGCNLHILIHVI